MKIRSRVFLIAGLAMAVSFAQAQDFSWQAKVNYATLDGDFADNERISVDATYYITPVSQEDRPLAEAAFLSRSSFVTMGWSKNERDEAFAGIANGSFTTRPINDIMLTQLPAAVITLPLGNLNFISPVSFSPPQSKSENKDFTLAMRYVTYTGYIVQADFTGGDGSSGYGSSFLSNQTDIKSHSLGFQFGQYLTPQTTMLVGYKQRENDQDTLSSASFCFPTPSCLPVPPRLSRTDTSADMWSVGMKHLIFAGTATHSVNARLAYEVTDTSFKSLLLGETDGVSGFMDKSYATILGAGYTYYPTDTLGLGVDVNRTDAENSDALQLGLQAQWFVRPNIALDLAYQKVDTDTAFLDTDADGWSLGITGRY